MSPAISLILLQSFSKTTHRLKAKSGHERDNGRDSKRSGEFQENRCKNAQRRRGDGVDQEAVLSHASDALGLAP